MWLYNTGSVDTCTVLTCSCTEFGYWSSSTYVNVPALAWLVSFFDGSLGAPHKIGNVFVRAVRGGL